MPKQVINTNNAPAPIGPYSQAIRANGLVFLSGQVAFIPATGELELSSLAAETHQVMKNIQAVLDEAKISFEHVVKTTIFLSDMSLFADVNAVYNTYFSGDFPARETVAVKGLPRGVNVEISMIAVEKL
ncbi:MAG: Rid family detoxifying hydrolase [Bacteroidetes bacterium]|jgi:2-iminobutanoate/2-iminopropanoate deaminase|nr:Rid family detoxifying hydrolase [Bacteroidota bacterium]TSA62359.1 MAG: RidA family protein [Sediminibacterium sp.]